MLVGACGAGRRSPSSSTRTRAWASPSCGRWAGARSPSGRWRSRATAAPTRFASEGACRAPRRSGRAATRWRSPPPTPAGARRRGRCASRSSGAELMFGGRCQGICPTRDPAHGRTMVATTNPNEGIEMDTYVIRRKNAWQSPGQVEEVGARSKAVADSDFPTDIRWIRSYLIVEDDGTLGSVCIYQASSPEAVRAHAHRVGMPADEIYPAATTVVIRPDPEQQLVGS